MPFGSLGKIYPNCYIMLIGNPGTRKSTAIKTAKRMLSASGFTHFSAEKTSKEKFLLDLSGDSYDGALRNAGRREGISSSDVLASLNIPGVGGFSDADVREVYICADEFNEFTGRGNLDFLSLLGSLWDWDDESATWNYRLKNSQSVSIYQPTINILGGNTHSSLQEAIPLEAVGQGFMSRLLLVHSEPSGRKITFPSEPPAALREGVLRIFAEIASNVRGPANIDSDAKHALDIIYRTWPELDDFRFKHYSTRRFSHLLKLCLICAASRVSSNVSIRDVLFANTMLSHAESTMPKALGEFGKSKNSEATQIVMNKLVEATSPVTLDSLWSLVSRDLDKRTQLTDILSGLTSAGKIQFVNKTGFLAIQKPVNTRATYVDYSLLPEMKGRVG